jgi:HlyD family secretion protein
VELVDRERQVTQAELASKGELKRAEIGAVQLELASLTLKRRQAELRAPADGIVTSLTAKVGEVLDAGQAVAAVADMSGFRLDVAVTSEDVGHLRVGLPVRVKLDAYDYQKYGTLTGRVIFIAPDSQLSSSSELPRIPTYTVKVALDDTLVQRGEFSGQVKLGMTGKAEIVTGQENILRLFLRSFRQAISLG